MVDSKELSSLKPTPLVIPPAKPLPSPTKEPLNVEPLIEVAPLKSTTEDVTTK